MSIGMWPSSMFRDPFSPFGGMNAQAGFSVSYAQVNVGFQAQLQGGFAGGYGPGADLGSELAMNMALQRFFAQAADPTAGFAPQPGLQYGVQSALQQLNQMGGAQAMTPDLANQQMMQQFQLLVAVVAFAMVINQMSQAQGGGFPMCGRPMGGTWPGAWGQSQKMPGGWDDGGWGRNLPLYNPGVFSGSGFGNQLAMCAENTALRRGTCGWCFAGAKESIARATGVHLQGGSAYMAANQLAASGRFREVAVSPSQLRQLPPGAVVVWGQTAASPHGHISVALGDGREASDHVQRQMTSLRGAENYRVFLPA